MTKLTITTDRKWKDLCYAHDVPVKVLKEQFDHLEDPVDGFIKYRRAWYHASDFLRVDKGSPLEGWHGYLNETYFSGIVIRLSDDGEQYQIGTFYS